MARKAGRGRRELAGNPREIAGQFFKALLIGINKLIPGPRAKKPYLFYCFRAGRPAAVGEEAPWAA